MQYSNSGGMLLAVVAMVLLVLLCRWVFSTRDRDQRTAQRLEKARSRGDYGLLVPVVTVRTAADAQRAARRPGAGPASGAPSPRGSAREVQPCWSSATTPTAPAPSSRPDAAG